MMREKSDIFAHTNSLKYDVFLSTHDTHENTEVLHIQSTDVSTVLQIQLICLDLIDKFNPWDMIN